MDLTSSKVEFISGLSLKISGILALFLALFVMIFFLPDRLLVAAILFIFLMLVLNRFSMTTSATGLTSEKISATSYEQAKSHWKKEYSKKQAISRKQNIQSGRIKSSGVNLRGVNGSIISINRFEKRLETKYNELKIRKRNELNDQTMELRIQSIFNDIRELNSEDYQKGLEEIRRILSLRQSSLIATTTIENMTDSTD